MSDLHERATSGEEVSVDYAAIERTLAELWRVEREDDQAVTRAALWNVVAHASSPEHHTHASEVLSRASATVPQRTIIIRANPAGPREMTSWISANCHLVGGGKQVCSEEIAIVAGGDLVRRVPPLVQALLLPDMPVAVWWLGDLPSEEAEYVDALLQPVDRLIVDSSSFDRVEDLELVKRVSEKTSTAPADLNWIRLEEWRIATAALFDPPEMRRKLDVLRSVEIVNRTHKATFFGESVAGLLYASWLSAQLRHKVHEDGKVEGPAGPIEYTIRSESADTTAGVVCVTLSFDDGSSATVAHEEDHGILSSTLRGNIRLPDSVTRIFSKSIHELITRQLKQPESDRLILRVLPIAVRLAKRFAG